MPARIEALETELARMTGAMNEPAFYQRDAAAIAEEVGLRLPGAIVLDGSDLPADDAVLGALVDRDGAVVSRITPEGKLRVAQVLRERGLVERSALDPDLEVDVERALGRSRVRPPLAGQAREVRLLLREGGAPVLAHPHHALRTRDGPLHQAREVLGVALREAARDAGDARASAVPPATGRGCRR